MSAPDERGDYLWDRSGPVDPELRQLERLLGRLAQPDPPPALGFAIAIPRRMPPARAAVMLAAAAAVVVAFVGVVWRSTRQSAAVPELVVTQTLVNADGAAAAGAPTETRLRAGTSLSTERMRASIDVNGIGRVDVEPGSRLDLVTSTPGDYRLRLTRGTLHALIWAPPGQFFVDTPSSTAIDLGCAYTLTVGDNGDGLVRVTSGWVGFEWHGRESFIPAGAVCKTRRGLGPGTPRYEDAPAAFVAALDDVDFGDERLRRAALASALAQARERDAVSLWHLLSRVPPADRDRVFDALAAFVPPPADVTRDGIRAGRRDQLDAWWNRLGLDTASWWRTWKQQWRGTKGDER